MVINKIKLATSVVIILLYFFFHGVSHASYYGKLSWKPHPSSAWRYYNLYKGKTKTLGEADGKATWVSLNNGTTHITLFNAQYYGGHEALILDRTSYLPSDWKSKVRSTKKGQTKLDFCFYEYTNQQGKAYCYRYHASNLSEGIKGKIKSIFIANGYTLTLYQGENYDGKSTTLTHSANTLTWEWQTKTRSALLGKTVCFFENTNFDGDHACYKNDSPELVSRLYKKAKSLTTVSPITVYDENNYKGDTNVFRQNISNLGDYSWSYKIASFRFDEHYPSGVLACFYYQTNYVGPRYCVTKDSSSLNWMNRHAKSVRVFKTITVYDKTNYGGNKKVIKNDVAQLSSIGWNDKIQSVKKGEHTFPVDAKACFYTQNNYQGERYCFKGNTAEFPYGIRKKSRSLRVTQPITVFKGTNYSHEGSRSLSDIPELNWNWRNAISSFIVGAQKLPPNAKACFFTEDELNGSLYCYKTDTAALESGIHKKSTSGIFAGDTSVFENNNYKGKFTVVKGKTTFSYDWKNRIASFKLGKYVPPPDSFACFYDQAHYQGNSECFTKDTASISLTKGKVKSIKLMTSGITLFAGNNYQGDAWTLYSNKPTVSDMWQSQTASIKKGNARPPQGDICLFKKLNFEGERYCYNTDEANLPDGIYKAAQSIKTKFPITVYEEPNYSGTETLISYDMKNLWGWRNRIASFKLGEIMPRDYLACFYQEHDFKSPRYCINEDASDLSWFKKRAKSIKIAYPIRIYDQTNYQGKHLNIDQNEADLGAFGWDNKVSSAKRRNEWPPSAFACFYDKENYLGNRQCFNADTPYIPLLLNNIASIKVTKAITVFAAGSFAGDSRTILSNKPKVSSPWSRIYSLKVGTERPAQAKICLFDQYDFKGERYCYDHEVSQLPDGILQKTKSLQTSLGITVYDQPDFSGDSMYFDHNKDKLSSYWSDRIASFKLGDHPPADSLACFYAGHNFTSYRYCISNDKTTFEWFNDYAKSVKIFKPITAYEHYHYKGDSIQLTANISDLEEWDNRISSAKRSEYVWPADAIACFFSKHNYQGERYCINHDIWWFGSFNDKARSVQIKENITVYENGFFQGESLLLDQNTSSLGFWDDRISSAKKGTHGWPESAIACFYTELNFQGGRFCIADDTPNMGDFAELARSLIAKEDITVYDEPDYQGDTNHYNGEYADLGDWQNQIASVKKGNFHQFLICLYEFPEYQGAKYCFTEDVDAFNGLGYDGSVGIYNPDKHGDGDGDKDEFHKVILYKEPDFKGNEDHHEKSNPNMKESKRYRRDIQTRDGGGYGSARIRDKRDLIGACN